MRPSSCRSINASILRGTIGAGLLFIGAFLSQPSLLYAMPIFGTNLIVNGNAEGGAGSPTGFTVVSVPGWTTVGNFTVVNYNIGGGFPSNSDPGPASRGVNFFAGGPNNAGSSASQVIDVSLGASIIDTGGVTFNLEGYLGGFNGQGDNTVLTTTFLDASNNSLGTALLGPVTAADRSNLTGLLLRNASGGLPIGTREIEIVLQTTRQSGAYNDGYADNLNLTLGAAVPEPSSLLLLGTGLVSFGLVAWRRKYAASAL